MESSYAIHNSVSLSSIDAFQMLSEKQNRDLLVAIFNAAISESLGTQIAQKLRSEANGDPEFLAKQFRAFRNCPSMMQALLETAAIAGDEVASSVISSTDALFQAAAMVDEVLMKHLMPYGHFPKVQFHLGALFKANCFAAWDQRYDEKALEFFFTALNFWTSASLRGHIDATLELGKLYRWSVSISNEYERGLAPPDALQKAKSCFQEAIVCGHLLATEMLENLDSEKQTGIEWSSDPFIPASTNQTDRSLKRKRIY